MPATLKRSALIVFLIVICITEARSQLSVRDSTIGFSMLGATGSYSSPSGDMAERFGNNYSIGAFFYRKTKTNWMWGFQGSFLFGDKVTETGLLDSLVTSQGAIIDKDGTYGEVLFYERGFQIEARIGKIFPVLGPNKNSGILFMAGAGLLQHKIRIESQGSEIPSIEDAYSKGYDRLSNGLCISEFLGYVNFGNKRMVNFFIGLEATQAFTQSRRDFNFDTRAKDETNRNDLLFGIRAGWIFPLYKRVPNAYYIN
jgi:hypothetical protein